MSRLSGLLERELAASRMQREALQQQIEANRMFGLAGLGAGMDGGLGQARQQGSQQRIVWDGSADSVDRSAPIIKYKPTIEAGDNIREVLQAETDEWLNSISGEI